MKKLVIAIKFGGIRAVLARTTTMMVLNAANIKLALGINRILDMIIGSVNIKSDLPFASCSGVSLKIDTPTRRKSSKRDAAVLDRLFT